MRIREYILHSQLMAWCYIICCWRIDCAVKTLKCPFSEDLIGKDTLDEYDLVYVEDGDDVVMPCCQKYPSASKSWYATDRFLSQVAVVLDAGLAKISDNFELTLNKVNIPDTGAYYCQDPWFAGDSDNHSSNVNSYYYLIDVVLRSAPISYGHIQLYQQHLSTYIVPISRYLQDYSNNDELRRFYEETGFTLQVDVRFDEWSDCDACKKEKKRVAHCHLAPRLRDPSLCRHRPAKCAIYKFALHMDCRSTWTIAKILPLLAERTKNVPDLGRIVKCVGVCDARSLPATSYAKKFRVYDVAVGANLMMVCPQSAINKQCFWRRDGNKIYPQQYDQDAHVSVNELAILRIRDASTKESGNYSCYVDDALVRQNRVRVTESFSEKNASWWRHLKYLQYIVLVCLVVLVGGLATAVIQRRNFQTIDVNEAAEKFLKRRFDHEKLQPTSLPPVPSPTQ